MSSYGNGGGVHLLSPTTRETIAQSSHGKRASSGRPHHHHHHHQHQQHSKHWTTYDFDGFTLESVRVRKERTGDWDSRRDAIDKLSAAMEASDPLFDATSSFRTMRCTEDFDAVQPRKSSRAGTVSTTSSSRSLLQRTLTPNPTQSSSYAMLESSLSGPPVMQHVPAPRKAEVKVKGWLQRRKGAILKRWKMQYCLFKEDDKLSLYNSEDTVNGKLQAHFQVLRVTFSDKHESFSIIGANVVDGTPVKEDFRAMRSSDWRLWFQAFREFFDAATIGDTLVRLPHSSVGTVAETMLDDDEDIREVEEMILKGSAVRYGEERPSFGNVRLTSNQDVYLYDSDDGRVESSRSTLSTFSGSSGCNRGPGNNQLTHDDASRAARAPSAAAKAANNGAAENSTGSSATTSAADSPIRKGDSMSSASDCPMIDRDSLAPAPVPLLEGRLSESTRDSENKLMVTPSSLARSLVSSTTRLFA